MPGKPHFNVDAIRALAQRRIEESSLRAVADEIGMSKSGLDAFLKGRAPYSKSRVRLATWYMRQSRPGANSIRSDEVEAALALIERYVESAPNAAAKQRRVREVAARLFSTMP